MNDVGPLVFVAIFILIGVFFLWNSQRTGITALGFIILCVLETINFFYKTLLSFEWYANWEKKRQRMNYFRSREQERDRYEREQLHRDLDSLKGDKSDEENHVRGYNS